MPSQRLTRQLFEKNLQADNIETLSYPDLVRLFRQDNRLSEFLPDGVCHIDPRDGVRVLFNPARAQRPHDNSPTAESMLSSDAEFQPCEVCEGKITSAVDVADLSEGFTFINKNLYPILYPDGKNKHSQPEVMNGSKSNMKGTPAFGMHFLQWTSSLHDRDWHNMPASDRVVVMRRLAALEKILLTTSGDFMTPASRYDDKLDCYGFVSIIKNGGRLVGGSLAHGHQQIAFSNFLPRRILDNLNFEQKRGEKFSSYLLKENPSEFTIYDYETAVLLVPHFMRRPYDMMLVLKDTHKRYLHDLTDAEVTAVSDGWRDAIQLIRLVMPQMGREIAYNVITHNGPGAGLYFEFLPYTQEFGGIERLGLSVCEANPQRVSMQLRSMIKSIRSD
jgi:galactose-1-phosphate uridylyltransferase